LHQKVALIYLPTLINVWLLKDLRLFYSDERIKTILLRD
jgi:hypothetical protein